MSGPSSKAINADAAVGRVLSLLRVDSQWGREGRLAEQLAAEMVLLGFEGVRLVEPLPGRPSVVGRIRGTGGGPAIILNGHLDIYELSSDWSRDPWLPAVDEGRIYGAGVADEKAGTAALLAAACEFLEPGQRPRGDIIFMGVSAHFEGGLGTRAILASGIMADGGITCEPSNLSINTSHRGAAYLNVVTFGKQAHTSAKDEGYNAVTAMVPVIQALEELDFNVVPDSLGGPILNIGTIAGGTKHNQVPDRCEISIDVRLPASLTAQAVQDAVEAILTRIAAERPGFRASTQFSPFWLSGPRHASRTEEAETIVTAVRNATASVGRDDDPANTLPVWSDMCVLNAHGIPSVNIGPGGPPYNWPNEYVTLEEYLDAVRIYKATILEFCNGEVSLH